MRLVLLDRDGLLNADRPDSVKSPAELLLLPGAADAVRRLNEAGRLVVVCTNQGVVGRGIIDEAMLDRIHDKLRAELARAGGRLDAVFHCPDSPERPGPRRKPAPGMLREAMARFRIPAGETAMIGDALVGTGAALAVASAVMFFVAHPPHHAPAVAQELPVSVGISSDSAMVFSKVSF